MDQYRKKGIPFLLIMVVVTSALYIVWRFHPTAHPPIGLQGGVIPVTSMKVQKRPQPLEEELSGRVVAYNMVDVRPQVDGIIQRTVFTEGAKVHKGDLLYEIDPSLYKAAYDSAQAQLLKVQVAVKFLETKSRRYGELVKVGVVSQQEYEDVLLDKEKAYADEKMAEASLETARIDLEYTKLLAPIEGYIGIAAWTEGALVEANQTDPLTQITLLDPIYVEFKLPTSLWARMRPSLETKPTIHLHLNGQPTAAVYEGRIDFIDSVVDESSDSILLRAVLPNPQGNLRPGLFIRAKLLLDTVDGVMIPQKATMRGKDGKLRVWIVDENDSALLKEVVEERALFDQWLIREGLVDGDLVVVEGGLKLTAGAKVVCALKEAL